MQGVGSSASESAAQDSGVDPFLWARTRRDATREAVWLQALQREGLTAEVRDDEPTLGVAVSVEPTTGDPNVLAVLTKGAYEPYWVDRRSMRAIQRPASARPEDDHITLRGADLVDRVQLCLGEPVAVGYVEQENKPRVVWVRPVRPRIQFTNTSCRRIAPFVGDRSTLSPLSVDALDRALRVDDERGAEPTVRRIFGRAYRRIGDHHTPWAGGQRVTRTAAMGRWALMAKAVTSVLTEAERYGGRITAMRAGGPAASGLGVDTQDLLDLLRARMGDVTDALVLLERARFATLGVLPLLDWLCGGVPPDAFASLATPRPTAERAAVDAKLSAFAEEAAAEPSLGPESTTPPAWSTPEWQALRAALQDVRVLGMDVRFPAMGADDAELSRAIEEARERRRNASERIRHDAERRLVRRAFRDWGGALRLGTLSGLLGLLRRLSRAKGIFAEGLSVALLQLRAVVLEAGRRLVDEGVIETPEDLFFLDLSEIEQALEGEVGAYASRIRFRREEDRRWRAFDAPRLIPGRRV